MNSKKLQSLGHAVLVLLYVSLVAFIMSHGSVVFGPKDTSGTPVAVLMLFVLSAAITGSLVLGRPIMMFMGGHKKEAIEFLGWTIGWLFILTLGVFIVMAVSAKV